jgi:undecaprenyl-phosphate 4-deoxy-4-formamido-L-arabinose transferase
MSVFTLSIVIPAYNSEKSLPALLTRLSSALADYPQPYEVLLVNDGSRDHTWQVIRALAEQYPQVCGIDMTRNFGQHNALLAGIRHAQYDVVVTMDDDLQNPPEEIPLLLQKLAEGYDVVYGARALEQHGLWRNLASQVTKLALKSAMGVDIARQVSAYRAFRTHLRQAFETYRGPNVSIDVLLTWATTRFGAVTVRHEARIIGTSNYTFRKLFTHAMNMMTGFSVLPLQFASWVGISFAFFGALVLIYVVGRYLLQGVSVQGFAFLASTIAIFSGAQLLALGIIGEYLARMHFRMMDRPTYVIRETTAKFI